LSTKLHGVFGPIKVQERSKKKETRRKIKKLNEGDVIRTRNHRTWNPPLCRWSYAPSDESEGAVANEVAKKNQPLTLEMCIRIVALRELNATVQPIAKSELSEGNK
jgi:hypothetical protein